MNKNVNYGNWVPEKMLALCYVAAAVLGIAAYVTGPVLHLSLIHILPNRCLFLRHPRPFDILPVPVLRRATPNYSRSRLPHHRGHYSPPLESHNYPAPSLHPATLRLPAVGEYKPLHRSCLLYTSRCV